ncbi:MAG: helix-turn-helix transcriptional regulator [Gemmatimonadota bacterium]|nr:helix-turn-helix transcriptional regulator [Gemmatimonadota bacterium]
MPYALSLRDSRQAGECARILATPLQFAGFDDWSREASESLRSLLGADKTTFAISGRGHLHNRSEVIPQAALREFIERYLVGDKFGFLTRGLALGAFNRELVWAEHRKEILRSAYWNELVRPAKAFDTIGLTARTEENPSGIANLQFYHDQETGPKFGARGLAILRSVYPAFAAGCRSWAALHAYSRHLASLIDTIPAGVVLSRIDGSIIHQNPGIRRMLAADPSHDGLRIVIAECIARFRRVWTSSEATMSSAPPRSTASDHHISGRTYRLSTSFLGRDVIAGAGAIVVVVEPISPSPFPASLLKDRYHLTGREVEVARLLAEGKTNLEIAGALGVSTFTARHHTESVMLKLGVRTRAKIAGILARLT